MHNHNPFIISRKVCKANAQASVAKSFGMYALSSVPLIILGFVYPIIKYSSLEIILWLVSLLIINASMGLLMTNLECIGISKNLKTAFPLFHDKHLLINEYILSIILNTLSDIGYALLFVPGVIFNIATSQAQLIYFDSWQRGQKLSFIQAIKDSNSLMYNHKIDFFILILSFIGWDLVILLTAGIAGIWIIPYITQTYANYYLALTYRSIGQNQFADAPRIDNNKASQEKYKGTVFGNHYRHDSDSYNGLF